MKRRILSGFYSVVANVWRAGQQVVLQKIVSSLFGPAGFLVFGAVSNLLSITNSLALGGIYNGLLARLAARKTSPSPPELLVIGVLSLAGLIASLCVLLLAMFVIRADWINSIAGVSTVDLAAIMVVTFVCYTLAAYLNAALVANGQYGLFAAVGLLAAAISLVLLMAIVYFIGNSNLAVMLSPAVYAFGVGLTSLVAMKLLKRTPLFSRANNEIRDSLKYYLPYAGMAACSALLTPLSAIYVLDVFYRFSGSGVAGVFLALTKLSDVLTIFIGPLIATHLYPKFVGCVGNLGKLRQTYKRIAFVFLGSLILFQALAFFSGIALNALYSDKFAVDSRTAHVFFLGEAFRMLSVTLGYLVISSGSFHSYLFFDTLTKGLLCLVAAAAVPLGGVSYYSLAYIFVWIIPSVAIVFWAERRSLSVSALKLDF